MCGADGVKALYVPVNLGSLIVLGVLYALLPIGVWRTPSLIKNWKEVTEDWDEKQVARNLDARFEPVVQLLFGIMDVLGLVSIMLVAVLGPYRLGIYLKAMKAVFYDHLMLLHT